MILLADSKGHDQPAHMRRSACAYAQADLGLRCSHVLEDTFPHATFHFRMALPIVSSNTQYLT